MNLLHRVLDAAYCTSSHHRMALDALPLMAGPEAFLRRNVCYFWHEAYLKGSKAPDDEFKDFRNHVLHVEENLWGGAPQAAREWFDRTVEYLKRENWDQAAFSAGVLSHYVTDPFQPFHTGSSDKETHYHRAVEWSVAKSFPALRDRIAASGGYPGIELPSGRDWLEETILAGAQRAHRDYFLPFERFDLKNGSATPEEGLDETLSASFAALIAQATATFAAILDRAWEESRAIPPDVNLTVPALVASLKMPIAWVVKKLVETEEQRTVLAIYDEIQRTGKLTRYLPEECHAIDMVHAQERLAAMPLSRFAERRLQKSKDESANRTPVQPKVAQAQPAVPQAPAAPSQAPTKQAPVAAKVEATAKPGETAAREVPAAERRVEAPTPSKEPTESKPRVEPPPAPAPVPRVYREEMRPAAERAPSVASGLMAKLAAANPFASKQAEAPNRTSSPLPSDAPAKEPAKTAPRAEERGSEAPTAKQPPAASNSDTKVDAKPQTKEEPRVMPLKAMSPPERKPTGEVARASAAGGAGAERSTGSAERRYYLELDSPIVDAPSIGPKTAKRFEQVGVRTVSEFLRASADQLAKRLGAEHLPAARLREFQLQTKLVLRISGLRGHDAQFLVGAGYTEPDEIAASKAEELLADVLEYLETPEGERALRSGSKPDLAEVRGWIESARKPRTLTANAA